MSNRTVRVTPQGDARIGKTSILTTDEHINFKGNNIVVTERVSNDIYVLRAEDIIKID